MNLNFKVFGAGEPVIILHGLFGMLDNWQTFAKALSSSHQVYIIDQRNHGKSLHSEEFSYPLIASDVATFLKSQHITAAHIIGHSMGGKTAMQFAHDYPQQALSLQVIDIAPIEYMASHLGIFNAIQSIDLDQLTNRKEADLRLSEKISAVAIRQFLLKNLSRTSEGFSWKANFSSLYKNYHNILGPLDLTHPIKLSSTFIYSTSSGYLEEKDIPYIQEYFPKATFVPLDAGHWIHAEKPNELLTIIGDTLKKR